jgi:hypothetical protein
MAQEISLPYTNVPLVPEAPQPTVLPKTTTFIGQKLAGGSAPVGFLQDVAYGSEDALFEAGSMLATMIKTFRKIDINSTVNAYVLEDNGAGVDATATVTFGGGPASGSGTITIYVGNTDRRYDVPVADTDDVTTVGAAFESLVTADADALVTANNVAGVVTLTAKNAGTVGNNIGLMVEDSSVAGITVALTAFASGATDPLLTSVTTGIGDVRTDIVMPVTYSYAPILTWLDSRFNYNNKLLNGVMFLAETDTAANIETTLSSENSQSLVYFADKPVDKATKKGGAIFAMPYEKTALFAAVRALRFSDNAIISNYVVATAAKDQFGGVHTASLPYHNTPLPLPIIPSLEGFTDVEVTQINAEHGSVMGNNPAANAIICGDVYTSYKTNSVGQPDPTYEYLNYVDTGTASREYVFNGLKIDYAQSRLTSGNGVIQYSFASNGEIRSNVIKYMGVLQGEGYVLIQAGTMQDGRTVMSVIKQYLKVEIDNESGDIFISSILPLVTQARLINFPLSIVFNPQNL